jgi:DNA helicase-2/ATP-dependent DNA helicase PcrA
MAARPGTRSPGNRPVPSLSPGDKVTHDAFGLGTVVSVYDRGEKASVDFGGEYGVRTLVLRFATIEKL